MMMIVLKGRELSGGRFLSVVALTPVMLGLRKLVSCDISAYARRCRLTRKGKFSRGHGGLGRRYVVVVSSRSPQRTTDAAT